jgi:hypothetical protein
VSAEPGQHLDEMQRIRATIARTDPAHVRERVLLVVAHERARRRSEQAKVANATTSPPTRASSPNRNRSEDVRRYARLVPRLRAVADAVLPADARVLVVSRGDDALLALGGRVTGHFPQVARKWAGFYPGTGEEAVAQLDALASEGWEFIVFPTTAFWWLEHYEKLASRLLTRGRAIWHDNDCVIFALATDHGEGTN